MIRHILIILLSVAAVAPVPCSAENVGAAGAVPLPMFNNNTGAGVDLSVNEKLAQFVNVNDFAGVDPTGVRDSSTGVARAIAAVCASHGNSGGTLYFPSGSYLLDRNITVSCPNLYIRGAGISATYIRSGSPTAGLFTFDGSNNQGMSDLYLTNAVAPTAGSLLTVRTGRNFSADRLKFANAWIGLSIVGGVIGYYSNFELAGTHRYGIVVANNAGDEFISNVVADNGPGAQPAAGILVEFTGGLWIDRVDMIRQGTGLLVAPKQATQQVNWLFVSNSAFDTNASHGIEIAPSGGSAVMGASFVNCWTSTNDDVGFLLRTESGASVRGVRLVGHRSFNNGAAGIVAADAGVMNLSVSASDIAGNSRKRLGARSGIELAAGVGDVSIVSNKIGEEAGFGNTQAFGIFISQGTSDRYTITSNDLTGNGLPLHDGGSGTRKVIKANLGYNPTGLATLAHDGRSPFAWTNNTGETVQFFITGGTIAGIMINGIPMPQTANDIALPHGATVSVGFSGSPVFRTLGN
jgi:hypothetical protein